MTTATKAREGKLAAVAQTMRTRADESGQAHTRLPAGLEIVMQRRDGRWRLALGREGVYPSDTEVRVCLVAFQAPEETELVRRLQRSTHPKTGRQRIYHIVECFWVER